MSCRKYTNSILSSPNIETVVHSLSSMRDDRSQRLVSNALHNGFKGVEKTHNMLYFNKRVKRSMILSLSFSYFANLVQILCTVKSIASLTPSTTTSGQFRVQQCRNSCFDIKRIRIGNSTALVLLPAFQILFLSTLNRQFFTHKPFQI